MLPQSLAAQRLGHLSVELPGRGVLLAGGLSRKPGEGFQISPEAELYTPALPRNPCAEPDPEPASEDAP